MGIGLIVLAVFWGVTIRLWVIDGPKLPVIFIGIWVAGYLAFLLGAHDGIFIALQAILALIMLFIEKINKVL